MKRLKGDQFVDPQGHFSKIARLPKSKVNDVKIPYVGRRVKHLFRPSRQKSDTLQITF